MLEAPSLSARAELVVGMLKRQLAVLRLSQKIHENVKGELSRNQREYFLRQQLKAIRDELHESSGGAGGAGMAGLDADGRDEASEVAQRLEAANLPPAAKLVADRELKRLRQMQPLQAEYSVLLGYLDWLASMPWAKMSEDTLDLRAAREILDREHFGLEKVKRRVYEHLAVLSLRRDTKGPILCLVGPPGVGKTSLGKAVAAALGRSFERIALGGVSDAAEIRGHRRTYVGSMPGLVVQALRRAESSNPVLLLDEIDKVGRDGRSDPTAALLEVLDPAQNANFTDHYLNLPVDLSKVLFLATANSLDTIPHALLDRMEVLQMSGYTIEEKLVIAQQHLVPRQVKLNGLPISLVDIPDATLVALAEGYTREAGLRNLEREIGALCRNLAVEVAKVPEGPERERVPPTVLAVSDLERILGPRKFEPEVREQLSRPGVALGLAWTPTGGTLLFIETSRMPGTGQLILTGQLGDVMQESVRTALTWIRSHARELGLTPAGQAAASSRSPPRPVSEAAISHVVSDAAFDSRDDTTTSPPSLLAGLDVHVHFPAAAIPKDGPSAGSTTLVALVSLLTGRLARSDTAMSGEISLRGQVLPVGGVRDKVLAAHRAGCMRVLLPHANRKDLHELTGKVRGAMSFVWIETIEQLLAEALVDGQDLVALMTGGSSRLVTASPEGKEQDDVPSFPTPPPPRPPPSQPLLSRSKL